MVLDSKKLSASKYLWSILLIPSHICQAFLHCFSFCASSDWAKEKKRIHAVCKCRLLFDPSRHPTFGRSQQGLKARVGFSGNFQLAHFTAELARAAFRLASLNSWNSFTPIRRPSSESGFCRNVESPTLPPPKSTISSLESDGQMIWCSVSEGYAVENPAVRSNFSRPDLQSHIIWSSQPQTLQICLRNEPIW